MNSREDVRHIVGIYDDNHQTYYVLTDKQYCRVDGDDPFASIIELEKETNLPVFTSIVDVMKYINGLNEFHKQLYIDGECYGVGY